MTTLDPSAIRRAIVAELDATPREIPLEVVETRNEGGLWFLKVRPRTRPPVPLDESYEGAQVWWPEPKKGAGDVLTVIPEDDELVLRFVTSPPPAAGAVVFLYPPRFLEKLLDVWRQSSWAERCAHWAKTTLITQQPVGMATDPRLFPWLRRAQRAAFNLTCWPVAFLWGPPGTGKTTTVGALVASYLAQMPNRRVLLLSTTNSAVDLALVSIDKALAEMAAPSQTAKDARQYCKRIGSHFIAKNYEGRMHLLPQRDPALVRSLIDHAAKRPDERDVHAYAAWKAQDEQLRLRLREAALAVLRTSQLAALTTTRAAFDFETLRSLEPFDLIVVDEASQVSLAYAAALAPLGTQTLFAGDPEQLAPIVRSENDDARAWLGNSAFKLRDTGVAQPATCFLDEQSRMAAQICAVVSQAFYDGQLKVAAISAADPAWKRARQVGVEETERVQIVGITAQGQWSAKFGGPIRGESADHIVQLVRHHLRTIEPGDIAILTPFRAQRAFIRAALRRAEMTGISVSTVHRAQGSERKIIFFDPVTGDSPFLNGREGARLINVALSRAQALLYIFASTADLSNPHLAAVAKCLGRTDLQRTPVFCELVNHPDFPYVMHRQVFGYLGMKLAFKELIAGGASLVTTEVETQERRRLSLDGARTLCGDPNKCPKGCQPNGTPRTQCIA